MEPGEQTSTSVVAGERTRTVSMAGFAVAGLTVGAVLAGIIRSATGGAVGPAAMASGLLLTQVLLAAILILLGSLVEGLGFGLSLGTHWPYKRNLFALMVAGDPEAMHRVVATLVGLIAVALLFLLRTPAAETGLTLLVLTGLLGMGTLYVLSGRIPSFVHGAHGLLAYGVFLTYLIALVAPGRAFWPYLRATVALHALLLAIFLGGMATGQRGFGRAIGGMVVPRGAAQWTAAVHLFAALLVVATLGWLMPAYPAAFYLAVAQFAVGFLLFHAVNLKPKSPGLIVALHQSLALLITVAIVTA